MRDKIDKLNIVKIIYLSDYCEAGDNMSSTCHAGVAQLNAGKYNNQKVIWDTQ